MMPKLSFRAKCLHPDACRGREFLRDRPLPYFIRVSKGQTPAVLYPQVQSTKRNRRSSSTKCSRRSVADEVWDEVYDKVYEEREAHTSSPTLRPLHFVPYT